MIMHACRKVEEASLIKCKVLVIHHWLSHSVHLTKLAAVLFFFQAKSWATASFPHTSPSPHHFVFLSFSFFIFYFGGKCCAKIKPQQFYLMLCIQSAPMGILSGSPWEMLCAFCVVKDNWFTSILSTDWLTCSLGRKEEIGGAWLKLLC